MQGTSNAENALFVWPAVPDQIALSQPAVQRGGSQPQGLAGSGRRRTLLALRTADVTAAIVTSPGQVSHLPSSSASP